MKKNVSLHGNKCGKSKYSSLTESSLSYTKKHTQEFTTKLPFINEVSTKSHHTLFQAY